MGETVDARVAGGMDPRRKGGQVPREHVMKPAAASLLLVLAVLVPAGAPARAEGGAGKAAKGGVFPEVTDAAGAEAKAILDDLKKALAGPDPEKVTQAVEPMVTKKSAEFVVELKKLLQDKREVVAAAAARALGSQGDKSVATQFMGWKYTGSPLA